MVADACGPIVRGLQATWPIGRHGDLVHQLEPVEGEGPMKNWM